MPDYSETYVHRIGWAGLSGIALYFCDSEERGNLKDISRLIKTNIPIIEEHPFKSNAGSKV